MTPSERERRIEAAAEAWRQETHGVYTLTRCRKVVAYILDAADEAVPMVSKAAHLAEVERNRANGRAGWAERDEQEQRADRAEAAARDFAKALRRLAPHDPLHGGDATARDVLARHPSFSGEEGAET